MSQILFSQLSEYSQDKNYIIGCDECGYGSIAGMLVVCGVQAPKNWSLEGLNDSKKLSEKRRNIMRDKLLSLVQKGEIYYHIAQRSNDQIDEHGLGVMLKDAYQECFTSLLVDNSLIVCDGTLKFDSTPTDQVSLVKADTLVPSVMAASILGKTYRDSVMRELHKDYPYYDWINNVGYYGANGLHIEGIKKYGYSPLHRLSYNLKVLQGVALPTFKV
jgi:ribonuclease HII